MNNDQADFKENHTTKMQIKRGINLGYFEQPRTSELLKIAGCVFL